MNRPLLVTMCCAAAAVASPAAAATTIAGGNVVNQTWTPAGSPYLVQGDVTVPAGASLTIQAGTVVRFAGTDGQGAGLDPARVELTAEGTLTVSGTAESPVVFEAESSTSASAWYGIVVPAAATSVTLSGAVIQHATSGIRAAGAASVQDTIIRTANRGVSVVGGAPTFDGLTVTSTVYGVYVSEGSPSLSRCVLASNTQAGLWVSTYQPSAVTVTGCSIHGNGTYGVYAETFASTGSHTVTITASNVTGNGAHGIYRSASSSLSVPVTFSNVWGNGTNYTNVTAGTGAFSANPLYVAPPGNLRLTSNSPSRRAGPAGEDLGALPYGSDPTPGLVGTLWADHAVTVGTTSVPGDLTVAPGARLTIPPGATLLFANTDLMAAGNDAARAELVVKGTLDAEGTGGAPVTFRGTQDAPGAWFGLEVTSLSSTSALSHARIEGAVRGLSLLSAPAGNAIHDVAIRASTYGVHVAGGMVNLDAITVTSGVTGLYLGSPAGGSITNAVVQGTSSDAISVTATSGTANVSIVNATVNGSGGHGVTATAWVGATLTLEVKNSIVTNSAGTGVRRDTSGGGMVVLPVTFSDVWGNGTNFAGASAGTGCISQNPMFVDAPVDLRLQAASVCVDAASSQGAPARDRAGAPRPLDGDGINGAAVDMGAYERPAAPFCGDGFAEGEEVCDEGVANGTYGHCAADCTGPGLRCGDGFTNGPEECDDGNGSNADACLTTCVAATCGDGFVQAGAEECDDANGAAGDGCSAACRSEGGAAPSGEGGGGGGGGGCSTAPGPAGAGLLALGILALRVGRRRR